ncbi:MAG: hypothetical protein M1827_003491 [Pycnora praestabilis]|nr:MAG: hypothetical protein M1827_003491 [Pycnora praestabilis]
MPPASNEEQFKFLISCIRYSNNGKVDFGEVAKECGIVTKGAAAKRYERMMKAHGIIASAQPIRSSTSAPSGSKEVVRSAAVKKRKVEDYPGSSSSAADDDEGLPKVKEEVGGLIIKDEDASGSVQDLGAPGLPQYSNATDNISVSGGMDGNIFDGTDDSSAFNALFQPDGYATPSVDQQSSHQLGKEQVMSCFPDPEPFSGNGDKVRNSILIAD